MKQRDPAGRALGRSQAGPHPHGGSADAPVGRVAPSRRVWLFDLDNTLHDASHAAFGETNAAMNAYMIGHLGVDHDEAARLRLHYLHRYGATLLGLVRHHGVAASHFLEETHRHPGLEQRLRTSAHDRAAIGRLRGRKFILTNAPRRRFSAARSCALVRKRSSRPGWRCVSSRKWLAFTPW